MDCEQFQLQQSKLNDGVVYKTDEGDGRRRIVVGEDQVRAVLDKIHVSPTEQHGTSANLTKKVCENYDEMNS